VTSDSGLKLSTNFPCLPRGAGKGRALEIDPSALEIDTSAPEKSSNEYMYKKILHRNRYYTITENNTLPQQTISVNDCRDVTKTNRKEKCKVVTEVSLRSNRVGVVQKRAVL